MGDNGRPGYGCARALSAEKKGWRAREDRDKSRPNSDGVLFKAIVNTRFGCCASYNIAFCNWGGAFYVVMGRIPPYYDYSQSAHLLVRMQGGRYPKPQIF